MPAITATLENMAGGSQVRGQAVQFSKALSQNQKGLGMYSVVEHLLSMLSRFWVWCLFFLIRKKNV